MPFDQLAQRLSSIGTVAPIGKDQYAELVAECRGIDQANDVRRLIALTCVPRTGRAQA